MGDQLVTDISGFNKLGVDSILVKTIDQKNQKWYTKINRLREKNILSILQKLLSYMTSGNAKLYNHCGTVWIAS